MEDRWFGLGDRGRYTAPLNQPWTCQLPNRPKHRWRLRFSLRALFFLVTVATVLGGWRYNQRQKFQDAAKKIQEHGGTIFYRWQEPTVGILPVTMFPAYFQISVPYQVTLPDGSKVTKTRMEPAGQTRPVTAITDKFYVRNGEPPKFQVVDFLCGFHQDVDFNAISIPAASIDASMIGHLSEVRNLEQIILEVDQMFYRVESSNRRATDERSEHLHELSRELRRATALIEENLPNVSLHKRGIVYSDQRF